MSGNRIPRFVAGVLLAAAFAGAACAHSASDAFVELDVRALDGAVVIDGRWDIALRDLDFALRLDDDGDGVITWGELRRHQAAIDRHAFARIGVLADGERCTLTPGRQQVTDRPDGAYAALAFRVACRGVPERIVLDYRLFFALDPSHRGIVVIRAGGRTSTALLTPQRPRVEFAP